MSEVVIRLWQNTFYPKHGSATNFATDAVGDDKVRPIWF